MKILKSQIPIAAIALTVFLVFSSLAIAAHPGGDVTLQPAPGKNLATDGYSPKATCGGCHDYGSGEKIVTKVQGYLDSAGKVNYMNYDVKSYAHGVSVGKHSDMGRNEELTVEQNKIWGPATISSPGMWGRF